MASSNVMSPATGASAHPDIKEKIDQQQVCNVMGSFAGEQNQEAKQSSSKAKVNVPKLKLDNLN